MLSTKVTDELKQVLALKNDSQEVEYIHRIESLSEQFKNISRIKDSVSEFEIDSKSVLIKGLETLGILKPDSTVVIWGCWYGSILIPYLSNRVGRVIGIDKDDEVIRFAKNKLFSDVDNVELITDDIFSKYRDFYLKTDLIINTACEYMQPVKNWNWFKHGALEQDIDYPSGTSDRDSSKKRVFNSPKLSSNCHFAFQSSDKLGIDGRTYSVFSIDEFKEQLPSRAEIMFEDVSTDSYGKTFTLIGKFIST